jgi:hypothetical protein
MTEIDRWWEPCSIQFPKPGERDWLALPVWEDSAVIPWRPSFRAMFEIRRAPATQPSTQPSTAPS